VKKRLTISMKTLFIACCFFLSIGFLSACSGNGELTDEIIFDPDTIPEQEISAFGEAVPVKWVTHTFPNGAGDLDIKVEEGDVVSRNQKLIESKDQLLLLNYYQAQANLLRAEYVLDQIKSQPSDVALAAAEAALTNAEANYDRLESGFGTDLQLDAAQADIDAAQANLDDLKAGASKKEIDAAENDLRAAEIAFERANQAFEIKASFEGTVVEIFVNSGEAVAAYQPVLLLADLSELQVITTDLSEIDVTRLRVGQRANVVFDALPDQTFEGTINRIAEKSSGVTSVYYEVIIELSDLPEEVRWGMTAFIVFPQN